MSKSKAPAVSASMIASNVQFAKKGEAQAHGSYGSQLGPQVGSTPPAADKARSDVRSHSSVEVALSSSSTAWPPMPGVVMVVKIAACHDAKYNARRKYHPAVIKERAASIAAEGQKVPAAAYPHPDRPGEFILIDGGYRKRALLHLGRDEIIIRIEEVKSDKDLYRLSRMYNKERDNGSALDDALVWKQLLDDGVVADQTELSLLTGEDKAVISRTMAILKLPEPVLDVIGDHQAGIGSYAGYELYLLSQAASPDDLMRTVEKVLANEITTRELEALRKRLVAPAHRKVREVSRIYKINGTGAQGFLKDWDNGKVAFEIKVDDPRKRAELIEELKQRFGLEAPEQQ